MGRVDDELDYVQVWQNSAVICLTLAFRFYKF